MKRIPLIAGCILLALFTAKAQLSIKPAIGLNFTDFSKDPGSGKYQSKVGYQFGGAVAFGKKIYLEPGFFWVRKSTEFVYQGTTNLATIKYDLSGIYIPLAAGVNLLGNVTSVIGLRVFGGPSVFLLASVKDLDKEAFKTASWGLFAGAGLDFRTIFVEAKYEWSLTNIQKDITRVDIGKTRSIFINAGVRIPI